ncbi:glyceraldehyde-3-phosphate dehydrogenase [Psychrobacter sp. HD31]|uniref:glyceraldehyde-3-phosphate dehydrogenase n=1 Tax=Psychrobacter sp. HD31 TaxID=3112003 RepID=UPI003DA67428
MSDATSLQQKYTDLLNLQKQQQQAAVKALDLLQTLQENDVEVSFLGSTLDNKSVQQLIAMHEENQLDILKTVEALNALVEQQITAAKLDIALLLKQGVDVAGLTGGNANQSQDVVLYGFGRIGRILTRLLAAKAASDKGLQLKAIVVRPAKAGDLLKRAKLLMHDSVHGAFEGSVVLDEENNGLIVNGRFIQVIYAKNPNEINYTSYGIDNALIIDNTGIWTDEEALGQHLQSKGVSKVLLTAPAKGDIKNIVYNVNDDTIGDDVIVSAASCTTNAITPTLKVLHDEYGVETGHVETIHSYTNDQNLIDNYHKKDRRGRSAGLNMVITSTGAAKAVGKALPELNGKLTGNAIRVPTPNVSMAILNLNLKTAPASADALNAFLQSVAESNKWQAQIDYVDSTEAVSTDFVGAQKVGIVDAQATIVTNNHATVYIWYDNEVGYSTQVLRVAKQMAGINYVDLLA